MAVTDCLKQESEALAPGLGESDHSCCINRQDITAVKFQSCVAASGPCEGYNVCHTMIQTQGPISHTMAGLAVQYETDDAKRLLDDLP